MIADKLQMTNVTRRKGKKRRVRSEWKVSMARPMELWMRGGERESAVVVG